MYTYYYNKMSNYKSLVYRLPVEIQRIINEYARDDKNEFLPFIFRTLKHRYKITYNIMSPISNKYLYNDCIKNQKWLSNMMEGIGEKKPMTKEIFIRRSFGGAFHEERRYIEIAKNYNNHNQIIEKFFIKTKKKVIVNFSKVANRLYKKYLENFIKNQDIHYLLED